MTAPLSPRRRGYPKCPDCKTATVVPQETHPRAGEIPTDLICAACGKFIKGTDEEVIQARTAERGWQRKEARECAAENRDRGRRALEEKLAKLHATGGF